MKDESFVVWKEDIIKWFDEAIYLLKDTELRMKLLEYMGVETE